jgi:hypothetical protein
VRIHALNITERKRYEMDILYRDGQPVKKYQTYAGTYENFIESVYEHSIRIDSNYTHAAMDIMSDCFPSVLELLEKEGKTMADVEADIPNTFVYKEDHRPDGTRRQYLVDRRRTQR